MGPFFYFGKTNFKQAEINGCPPTPHRKKRLIARRMPPRKLLKIKELWVIKDFYMNSTAMNQIKNHASRR